MTDYADLIEEARHLVAAHPGRDMLTGTMHLLTALADALEAAEENLAALIMGGAEIEWEYELRDANGRGQWGAEYPGWFIPSDWPDGWHLVRRRKPGPWEPVPTEEEAR